MQQHPSSSTQHTLLIAAAVARLRTRLTSAGADDVLVNTWGHGWSLTRPH